MIEKESFAKKKDRENEALQRENLEIKAKLAKASSSNSTVEEAMRKISCEQGHPMKRVPRKPGSSISCDYCQRDNIGEENLFYYTCSFICNFDMCPCCYLIALMGHKDALIELK